MGHEGCHLQPVSLFPQSVNFCPQLGHLGQ
jgi:hypothetical protein